MLAERGHEVTYWTSTFSHTRKTQRFKTDTDINIRDNYKIKLLHSPGYRKNISIARLYDHVVLAKRFGKIALEAKNPDIILCSMPTIELSLAATQYGKRLNVPVVLDVRDMWPDIFLEVVPSWANGIGRVILSPLFRNLKQACEDATAFFGITQDFLDWGLGYAGRKRNSFDAVFHHGYSPVKPTDSEIAKAESFWKQHGISKDNTGFIVCFFGYLGRQFEIETVLEAANKVRNSKPDIRFVLCGNGDSFEHDKTMAKDLNNVVFPGFVGHSEIWTLMRMASVGLAPYKSTLNFTGSLPNKVGEYLSAGLPVISSLKGELEKLLERDHCGITYPNSDSQKLANILLDLHENRKKLGDMGGKAGQVFGGKFDAQRVYGDLIDHLEAIAGGYDNQLTSLTTENS